MITANVARVFFIKVLHHLENIATEQASTTAWLSSENSTPRLSHLRTLKLEQETSKPNSQQCSPKVEKAWN